MQYRRFTYALRPTGDQAQVFGQFAGVCRLVWNLALEQRRDHSRRYRERTGRFLNYYSQARELTALRADFEFIRAVSVDALQRTLKALDRAYRRAWRGQGGFPRARKKGVTDTFSFAGREVLIEKVNRRWSRVRLPKIGWVKFRDTRPIGGTIREVTVFRSALGWQISICCDVEAEAPDPGGAVGIDRGVTSPLVLSDGTSYQLPLQMRSIARQIQKANRVVSRRRRGSRRRAKANRRAAKLQAKQARIRKDWAHKATTEIARRYSTVVVESLRTGDMTRKAHLVGAARKRGLNREIRNVGWYQIENMLAYKAASLVKVDAAYTSQTCASCGTVDKRSRESQASFVCTACGHRDNADRNAAVVILIRGSTPGVEPCRWAGVETRTSLAA